MPNPLTIFRTLAAASLVLCLLSSMATAGIVYSKSGKPYEYTSIEDRGANVQLKVDHGLIVVPKALFQPESLKKALQDAPKTAPKSTPAPSRNEPPRLPKPKPVQQQGALAGDDPLGFHTEIVPLLKQHCYSCHGEEEQKAAVTFAEFTDVESLLSGIDLWERALDSVDFEEMPPDPHKTGFTRAEADKLITWIEDKIINFSADDPLFVNSGPAFIRQLTPYEYSRSISGILDIEFDVSSVGSLKMEAKEGSFQNVALAMHMEPALYETYLLASEEALNQFFGDKTGIWATTQSYHGGVLRESKEAREALLGPLADKDAKPTAEEVREVLTPIMRLAYRRPIEPSEVTPYLALYGQMVQDGANNLEALQVVMRPIFASPNFLLRIERDQAPPGSDEMYRINDLELATRLSYFLWASGPDKELLDLAEQNDLSNPEVLAKQVERMLLDDRAAAMTDHFGKQWLQWDHFKEALPDRQSYPEFDNDLKKAMESEVIAFLNHLRQENASILDLIDSDYTFANKKLAKFYGLKANAGKDFEKVALHPNDNRGGLLGMAAILTMTSHTDRTKPSLRGKWVLDVLFGTPPPPPPPNVGTIDDGGGDEEAATFREKLEAHSNDPACAGCHKKIDPIGFALDQYNGIGEWRKTNAGVPLNTTGELPTGEKLTGVQDLKQVILSRKQQFAKNFTSKLLSYALGRELAFYDRPVVDEIVQQAAADNYRFGTIVWGIVNSRPFIYRKNLDSLLGESERQASN